MCAGRTAKPNEVRQREVLRKKQDATHVQQSRRWHDKDPKSAKVAKRVVDVPVCAGGESRTCGTIDEGGQGVDGQV
nr:hypothetical protein CFP56_11512 [Quercus suber]